MSKEMLITVVEGEESRIAVVEDGSLEELYLERASVERHVGNIYKGRVNNVEPTIQAAFVDIGMPKNGFLHASDVLPSAHPRRKKGGEGGDGHGGDGGRHQTIQEIFRPGDEVIVQITKEGIGTKGPSLTTALSIPGRYLVLMPGLGRLGVSRKIEDEVTRRELRDLLSSCSPPPDTGFIVRTAGVGRSKRELQSDLQYLLRLWKVVQARAETVKAPAEMFRESDLVMRTLRDVYTSDITTVWIDSEPAYKRVREFMKIAMPRHVAVAKLYTERVPLFHKYHVEEAIERIYSRTVPLPKGGSLVIDQTEALVAVDVNSGRFKYGRDAEESAHQLNVMAAKEIARQVRMRDLGGLIIMDFVDMDRAENRRSVEKTLRDAFKGDRARQQMLHISKFGIIEMTRQRVQPSLERSTFMDCPHCLGTGIIKHPESLALEVLRHLKMLVSRDLVTLIEVTMHPTVADYINNTKRASLARLEADTHKRIRIISDAGAPPDRAAYRCTDDRGAEVRTDLPPMSIPAPAAPAPQPSAAAQPSQPQPQREKRSRRHRKGRPSQPGQSSRQPPQQPVPEASAPPSPAPQPATPDESEAPASPAAAAQSGAEGQHPEGGHRRGRGRHRGGRRSRGRHRHGGQPGGTAGQPPEAGQSGFEIAGPESGPPTPGSSSPDTPEE
jgi:ribonuclease E